MRVVVAYEDALYNDWFMFKDSAILPEEAPLTWGYDWSRLPIGKAIKFQREVDGEVSAELRFFKEEDMVHLETLLSNGDVILSIYGSHVKEETYDSVREIHSYELKAVVIVINAAMPTIKKEG